MGKISHAGIHWLRFADDRYKSKIFKTPQNVSKQLSFESLSPAAFKNTKIFDLDSRITWRTSVLKCLLYYLAPVFETLLERTLLLNQ